MIFWVDAQLPPSRAPWLTERFGVEASSMRFLGLRDAEGLEITDDEGSPQMVELSVID